MSALLDYLLQPARMQFCEPSLHYSFLRHPADTWTNISPFIAGLCIVYCERFNTAYAYLLRFLGYAAMWMAVASGLFHATDVLFTEALDLHGMYLFLFSVILVQHVETRKHMLQIKEFKRWRTEMLVNSFCMAVAWLAATTLSVGFLHYEFLATPVFGIVVAFMLAKQIMRDRFTAEWYSVTATFLMAWLAWWADYLHILCNPHNHIITGHGVWHLLNGLVVWQFYCIFRVKPLNGMRG
jgi:hypothetical protein